jgi:two-component system sensor histidine kinase KdpD
VNENGNRPSPESLLARLNQGEQAKLRVYIGAAPGVGKTYQMLADTHLLKKQGADIVVAAVETHGREDTRAMIGNLECVPMRRIEYRGVTLEEMDVDAVIARHPGIAIVDELAHTNVPGSKNRKRYRDVLDILNAGISVITAVNIQHLDAPGWPGSRSRVRESSP